MNSVANGLTATLLMFVPLLAVPFLAAFGVSMPTQDIAAGAVDLETLDFAPELPEPGAGHSATARRTPEDLFAPLDNAQPAGNTLPPASSNDNPSNGSPVAMAHPLSLPSFEPPADNSPPSSERADADSEPTSLMVNTPAHQPKQNRWENPFEDSPAFGASTPSESITRHQEASEQPSSGFPKDLADSRPLSNESPSRNPASPRSANPFEWNADLAESANTASDGNSGSPSVDDSVFGPPSSSNSMGELAVNDESPSTDRTLFGPPGTPDRRVNVPDPQRSRPREPEFSSNDGWESEAPSRSRTPSNPVSASKPKTWMAADKRLRELNIKYKIVPDQNDRLFHLRCVWTSPNNPRVTRNFEASGRQPLEAAWGVLAQVEEWHAKNQ
ncbi:hypothetical protein [Thalassoroseus pseudoceratinae]|uniref:hypothetical protein n=1 Tax=Thalassoroseus pseudoceratinae TaxID=2713176 RepID=UPI001420C863|nr:hypothetical protein [Thalassoroseus pseudoceratinae]